MRTNNPISVRRLAITATVLACCLASTRLSGEKSGAESYHIFVGLNLSVRVDEQHLPVSHVNGGYIYALENGRTRTVPYYEAIGYRMDTDVKVSDLAVSLTKLKAERAYTPAAHPQRKWDNSQMDVYIDQMMHRETAERLVVSNAISQAMTSYDNTLRPEFVPLSVYISEMDASLLSIPGGDAGFYRQRLHDELREEMYDAIELEFEIAAPQAIPDPYFVAIGEFEDPQKPKQKFHWIYAEALDELSEKPRKVRVFKGGFPPGYKLLGHRVHVFSRRIELATNVSEKHIELDREDAHLYLRAQYENENRGKDLKPKPLWTALSAGLRSEIPEHEFRRILLLDLDENGLVSSVRPEDNEYGALDRRVVEAVKTFRFYPALLNGKPVPGTLRVQFSEMTRRRPQAD